MIKKDTLITTIFSTLLLSCAGPGMTQYVVINPVTKDEESKYPAYDYAIRGVHKITLDYAGSLCRKDKNNKVHIYTNGKKRKIDCESLESEILKNYDFIDSVRISNGERYSKDELVSIPKTGLLVIGIIGVGSVIGVFYEDEKGENRYYRESAPLWTYPFTGLIAMFITACYHFDLNGSMLYMAQPGSASTIKGGYE